MADAHLDYDGWEWHYDTAAPATLTNIVQTGATTEITIPANLDGSTPLTAIAANCFKDAEGAKITKVLSMPATITTIGANAFQSCVLLTSVVIGTGVTTIGGYAFASCTALTSVTVPNNVTSLGAYAFNTCSSLTSATIGNGVTSVGEGTFRYSALTSITLGTGITSIGVNAFNGLTGLTSVTLPTGLVTIGGRVFESCSGLTAMIIPANVTTIDYQAFKLCSSLTSISFLGLVAPTTVGADWILSCPAEIRGHAYAASNFPAPGNAWNGLTMGTVLDPEAHLDDGGWEWWYDDTDDASRAILLRVVRVGTASTEVNIPEHLSGTVDILSIAANCFKDAEGAKITKVLTMPATITTIGASAFQDCVLLISCAIGTGVTSIGANAFSGCTLLRTFVGKLIHTTGTFTQVGPINVIGPIYITGWVFTGNGINPIYHTGPLTVTAITPTAAFFKNCHTINAYGAISQGTLAYPSEYMDDVTIKAGTFTANALFHCKNLTIASGATFVQSANVPIIVCGSTTNSGTYTQNTPA